MRFADLQLMRRLTFQDNQAQLIENILMPATITENSSMRSTVHTPQPADQSTNVAARVQRLDRLGEWLDVAIEIPGIGYRVGWDTIIGLVPGIGDVVTTTMSAWIINEARQLGVSKFTLARMIVNTSLDALIGAVPVAGDLFDAAFKANVKNLELLRRSLRKRGLLPEEDRHEVASVRVREP